MSSCKQVLVVRKDLNMRKGKIAAQAAHGSLAVILNKMYGNSDLKTVKSLSLTLTQEIRQWLVEGFTKITVSVNSDEELLEIYNKAKANNLNCVLITDSGKTEFGGISTRTVVAIGPNYCEDIDKITGHLPLL